MEKTGLVLSGGGSRGAYEIGVWRAITELGERISVVTGSSVGALNGAMVAQGDYDTAERLWYEMETEKLFAWTTPARKEAADKKAGRAAPLLRAGMDPAPLEALMRRYIDEKKVRASPIRLGLVTVCLNARKTPYFWADELEEGSLHDYLLASSAFFPAIRPRKIGNAHYIDGAFADNMPVQMALEAGATRIIAVRLDAPGIIRRVHRQEGVALREIHSWWNLGAILLFDPASSRQNSRLGYLDAMRAYGVYDGCAYALIKGSLEKLLRTTYLPAAPILLRLFSDGKHPATGSFEKLPAPMQKRLHKRGLGKSGVLRALALDGLECAGELFGVDPCVLYSLERFSQRLHEAVTAFQKKKASSDLLFTKCTAVLRYSRRLACAMMSRQALPLPSGLLPELLGGLSRGESGFSAAVYLAVSGFWNGEII